MKLQRDIDNREREATTGPGLGALVLAAALALILAGCGGGSSGSDDEVADDGGEPSESETQAADAMKTLSPDAYNVGVAMEQASAEATEAVSEVMSDGMTTSSTRTCVNGGEIVYTYQDENPEQDGLAAGDRITAEYLSCVRPNTVQLDGTLALTIDQRSGEPTFDDVDWELSFTQEAIDFTATLDGYGYALDGTKSVNASFDAETGVTRYALTTPEIAYTRLDRERTLAATEVLIERTIDQAAPANYTSQRDYILIGRTPLGNDQTLTAITEPPFAGIGGSPPESGRLEMFNGLGQTLIVEALGGGSVRIALDTNADGDFNDFLDQDIITTFEEWIDD